jgi:hypothetical protein
MISFVGGGIQGKRVDDFLNVIHCFLLLFHCCWHTSVRACSPWLIEGSMIFALFSQGGEEHNLHNLFDYKWTRLTSGSAQVIANSEGTRALRPFSITSMLQLVGYEM